jgi:hypothetical protein
MHAARQKIMIMMHTLYQGSIHPLTHTLRLSVVPIFEFCGKLSALSSASGDTSGIVSRVDKGESMISAFPLQVSGALAASGSL